MNEREQLAAQWATLSVAQRENLFRSWVLAATSEFPPATFVFSGGSEVEYSIASNGSSWQVSAPATLFSRITPDDALAAGDEIVEIGHFVAEFHESLDELPEVEFEDESVEGTALAIIPVIIDALEQERLDLENALGDDEIDEETQEEIEEAIDEI